MVVVLLKNRPSVRLSFRRRRGAGEGNKKSPGHMPPGALKARRPWTARMRPPMAFDVLCEKVTGRHHQPWAEEPWRPLLPLRNKSFP